MAVYYLGNPVEKRKRLMSSRDAVYVDNDDVLASYGKGNKYYFIKGRVLFGGFNVLEYLSYAKSLELRRPLRVDEARELLARVGVEISLKKKLKKLDPITLKAVKLSTQLKPDTTRIGLNLDGVLYSRKAHRRLQKLINVLCDYSVAVSVSDIRFVPKDGGIEWFASLDKNCKAKIIKESKKAVRLFS